MADLITMGLFTVFVLIGTAWMLKTKKALDKRMQILEAKKEEKQNGRPAN